MLRGYNFLSRNSNKNSETEERENVPQNPKESLIHSTISDSTRAPLHSIPEPIYNHKSVPEQELSSKHVKTTKTPVKDKSVPFRTPEKPGVSRNNRFGWAQRNEQQDDTKSDTSSKCGVTPKSTRTMGKANLNYSECNSNSTQITPTKSVSKPPNPGFCLASGSRPPVSVGPRIGNYAAMSKGLPITCSSSKTVNSAEVQHFDLKEDPSFWMEHNVQVLIRVRPLNSTERSRNGYERCLKQESAQCITWIGHPETRFTFDHVACETIDQETLFRMAGLPMVENCLSGYHSCVFAYGQTGSGKTYTMLGQMEELEVRPSPNRGMTARIFEFLFARIRAEEELRTDERLRYSCRCSFLEIYNEQITDLLEPSATNLQLREDTKNGVYVENLSEFEVESVGDILKLLSQGSSNRKVAATNMNRESSRSHSVFTCTIESTWEKDATANSRFARMNLVDLAGSERQKSSGAEGERLKEAANINKSLSTLGHVIMVLIDIAQGKPRHVPYRDSRLTFLLQDSLGGNSKTMIIANVSPSICCAAETLNTLKFAQRAKLIQNNAVVNEDSSGDVTALQNQIRLLKEELGALKRQNVFRSLSFGPKTPEDSTPGPENLYNVRPSEMDQQSVDSITGAELKGSLRLSSKQMKSLETTLAGALRREQMSEISIKKLEAEIEQLNRLVRQREEHTQCTNMMLKLREEKIQRMESLMGGLIPADSYLRQENNALSAEIKLLQAKVDKNPEVTRFAMEYDRVLEQVRKYQDFYEEGEREMLLAEVSELRNQLVHILDGTSKQHNHPKKDVTHQEAHFKSEESDFDQFQLNRTLLELEECRTNLRSCLEKNELLTSEIEDLRASLNNLTAPHDHDGSIEVIKESIVETPTLGDQQLCMIPEESDQMKCDTLIKHAENIMNLELEVDILKEILKEERSSRGIIEDKELSLNRDLEFTKEKLLSMTRQYEDMVAELKEAKSVIEALESQQIFSINEMEDLRNSNTQFAELVSKQETEISTLKDQIVRQESRDLPHLRHSKSEDSPLQVRLKKMQISLEKAKKMNTWYQSDRAYKENSEEEMDEIRKQVEAETAEVIVCLQDELSDLQKQVQESTEKELEAERQIMLMADDNIKLREELEVNKKELKSLSKEWEVLSTEIEIVLADGHEALKDASNQVELISSSPFQKRTWIFDQVERVKKIITEKEMLIHDLNQCLEDANNKTSDLECLLRSLRGATLVITEAHQQECNEKDREILALRAELSSKASTIAKLETHISFGKEQLQKTSVSATAAFVILNRLSEVNSANIEALLQKDEHIYNLGIKVDRGEELIRSLRKELDTSAETCEKLRLQLSTEQQRTCAMEKKLLEVQETDILKTSEKLAELKAGVSTLRSCMNDYASDINATVSNNDKTEIQTGGEREKRFNNVESCAVEDMELEDLGCSSESDKNLACQSVKEDAKHGDDTIVLLRKEIEYALESLEGVQAEIGKLHEEKEKMRMYERSSQESRKSVLTLLVTMQEAMSTFEKQLGLKMASLDDKLLALEEIVQEVGSFRCHEKEVFEFELCDAKAIAAQKSAEASCLLSKFEEAQDTVGEADIVINKLMIAHETMKLEINELKKVEVTLTEENSFLYRQVQSLQSINDMKDLHCENLEKEFALDFIEMKNLVLDLEGIIAEVYTSTNKEFMSLSNDFLCMKDQLRDSAKMIRSLVEGIWSEIIVRDSAVSVLHLCHMGLLLETVNGLNVENGLLHCGLTESNSVINELKEHNYKSKRELEICRVLKGKLLADIKNGFDRISKKEDESGEFTVKLIGFEKKIVDLQRQEESMLERSNIMGFELSRLIKELDQSNHNILTSLEEQESLLKDREEVVESLEANYMIDLCAKDFESLVLASHFQMVTLGYSEDLENMKREIIFLNIDAESKQLILLDKEEEISRLMIERAEEKRVGEDLLSKITERNSTIVQISKVNEVLEKDIQLLKDASLSNDTLTSQLGEEVEAKMRLLSRVQKLEDENWRVLDEMKAKELALEMSSSHICALEIKIKELQDEVSLQNTSLGKHQNELTMKDLELSRMSSLEMEKELMGKELQTLKQSYYSVLQNLEDKGSELCLKIKQCLDSVENVNLSGDRISAAFNEEISQVSQQLQMANKFVRELEILEESFSEMMTENLLLHTELSRKDDILSGLQFDLSLLQEFASINKDHKDEIKELVASIETLEDELALRTHKLDEAVESNRMVEALLEEKTGIISSLRLDISKLHESIHSLSSENLELTAGIKSALEANKSVVEELSESKKMNETLEREHEKMGNALSDINNSNESLRSDLIEITCERDDLHAEILILKKQLEMTEALAEENEAIATEAREIAESKKVYAQEKDEEVKLLEKSVEELECTVDVLENKVNIVKEEAERQRLEREELELELHALKQQTFNVKHVDADMKRHLDEKEKEFQEALQHVQILAKEIAARDSEIAQCKAHIAELNLHAEAQTRDYKQKFKALETMAEHVKPEGCSAHITNSSSTKMEKNGSKSRGSGSPFKCIGLGMSQQIKSEKDEELTASRLRVEELEDLASNQQKEIFMLNTRLAKTDSMTHDLLRELSGLKLVMTKYASLCDDQLLEKVPEHAGQHSFEAQVKDNEVIRLKQQLNEFIDERKGWLEEIDRKQSDMVAAQVALEELRQRERLLSTENEMIKMEHANHKRKINELEMEVKKLSGQQNLQQRIHHHAKIKEENNLLKSQNEELSKKVRRMDSLLARVKEELAQFRIANGRSPCIKFDEEQKLNHALKETEEERCQLAQKLGGLCTSILKAAGVNRPASDVSISAAEEALDQIKNRMTSLEKELQDIVFKKKISDEKIRLSALMPQQSPLSPRTDENRPPLNRMPQSQFLSTLDR